MTLLLRADAAPEIGIGHVMRCLALAQAWQAAGGRALLAWSRLPPPLARRLEEEGLTLERLAAPAGGTAEAAETARLAERCAARWVAVDGYHLGPGYQRALHGAGRQLLLIDDADRRRDTAADLILNQNLHAAAELYPAADPRPRLLLGPRYALLRREFADRAGGAAPQPERVARLLVTLGGGEAGGLWERVLEQIAAAGLRPLEVTAALGPAAAGGATLERRAEALGLDLVVARDRSDMAALMAASQLAIAAAGSTSWELACMGLPALVLTLADNQRPVARALDRAGLAIALGDVAELAPALAALAADRRRRVAMSRSGRRTVDGRGAARVVGALLGAGGDGRSPGGGPAPSVSIGRE